MKYFSAASTVAIILACRVITAQSAADYPITPVPFTSVSLADSFWLPKIRTNHTVTIPHALVQSAGRIRNFSIAAGLESGIFQSQYPFDDSDIYKIIEAASYSLYYNPDASLEKTIDSIINIVAQAQEPDGYIYTARQIGVFPAGFPVSWLGASRWEKEHDLSHETYNMGHLFEAACAWYQATGKDNLLQIAVKAADLMDNTFGWGKLETYPGHQIAEVGLARLYRLTGEVKYLNLARFLLDVRGPGGEEYCQAHLKVTDQTTAVGHSVRAAYMYAGMADVAALFGERSYIDAITSIWEDIVTRKIYVTGGIGASGGNEGFSEAFHLPNSSAYCETCASIGNIYLNHRLFMLHGDSRYIDILERTLYNSLLSGVSLSGDRFFYPNRLYSSGSTTRSVWFGCACCPPNIAKLIPSVPGYIYAFRSDTLYVNLFMSDTARFGFDGGDMEIIQSTGYPYGGSVSIELKPEVPHEFALLVRIPGWARNEAINGGLYFFTDTSAAVPVVKVNGQPVEGLMDKGYAVMRRTWNPGDRVTVELPMEVRKVLADERVTDNRGRFAVQRGPLVYCAEGVDNGAGFDLYKYELTGAATSRYETLLQAGAEVIRMNSVTPDGSPDKEVTMIPYYMWSNRGASKMQVWHLVNRKVVYPDSLHLVTYSDIATTNYVSSWENLNAIFDLYDPVSSADKGPGAFGNWASDGRTRNSWNWVQYTFSEAKKISSSEVYWWKDGAGISLPDSSYISWYDDATEKFVKIPSTVRWGSGILLNQHNKEVFEPVNTRQVRLNFYGKNYAQGILEWKVYKPGKMTDVDYAVESLIRTKVYPNPATTGVTVETETDGEAEIVFLGIDGRVILRRKFSGSLTIGREEIGGMGVYIYRIVQGQKVVSGRLLVI